MPWTKCYGGIPKCGHRPSGQKLHGIDASLFGFIVVQSGQIELVCCKCRKDGQAHHQEQDSKGAPVGIRSGS